MIYLSKQTWLGDAGKQLAKEVRAARAAGLPVVMVHENDMAGDGCEFGLFFSTTPADLIQDGLYKALALALYPGPCRPRARSSPHEGPRQVFDDVSFHQAWLGSLNFRHRLRKARQNCFCVRLNPFRRVFPIPWRYFPKRLRFFGMMVNCSRYNRPRPLLLLRPN